MEYKIKRGIRPNTSVIANIVKYLFYLKNIIIHITILFYHVAYILPNWFFMYSVFIMIMNVNIVIITIIPLCIQLFDSIYHTLT